LDAAHGPHDTYVGYCSDALALASGVRAQQPAATDSSRAVTAAQAWLELVDSGNWQASVDSASELFRQMVGSPANWQQFATSARSRYPVSGARTLISWEPSFSPDYAPAGRYARVTFEIKGVRTTHESIVLVLSSTGWRVAMYGLTGG
jgi:hypothetical protein